jgi:hypothetical protein
MQTLYAFIILFSLVALVVGLWKPSKVLPRAIPQNRLMVTLIYFGLIVVILAFLPAPPKVVKASTSPVTAPVVKTEVPKPATVAPKPAAVSKPESQWVESDYSDGMGRKRFIASLPSTNTMDFGFPYGGDQHARLTVRASASEIHDIIFGIERGQFSCSISDCYIQARFDNGAIRRYSVSDPDDHKTTVKFISDYRGFLSALRKAKTVRIEASFYQEGNRTFEFNTAGFDW